MSKSMIVVGMKPTQALQTDVALNLLEDDDRGKLIAFAQRIESVAERLERIEITSDAEAGLVNDLLGGAKAAAGELEARRVLMKAPVLQEGQAIDAMFRPAATVFAELERIAKGKLIKHIKTQQEAAAKALREAERLKQLAAVEQEEAARLLQAATNAVETAAAEKLLDAASTTLIEAHRARPGVDVPTGIRSSFAASNLRGKKVVKIIDIKKVKREILEEALTKDPKPLLAVVAILFKGQDHVEGCILDEEDILSTRPGLQ